MYVPPDVERIESELPSPPRKQAKGPRVRRVRDLTAACREVDRHNDRVRKQIERGSWQ